MKILKPYVEINSFNGVELMKNIEKAGRTCYKSHVSADDSYKKFIENIVKSGHESVIEHEKVSVRFLIDRGAMWDITRHRHASFSIESSRWCNYSKEKFERDIKFIEPFFLVDDKEGFEAWKEVMQTAEKNYFALADKGYKADVCRMTLPASLATEIAMTCNLREWRHILQLRCAKNVHPHVKQIMIPLLLYFKQEMPEIFADIPYDEEFSSKYYAEVKVI